jgi:hypothetical protein
MTRRSAVSMSAWSGGRGELHPPVPTDPGVSLSAHRALVALITRPRFHLWVPESRSWVLSCKFAKCFLGVVVCMGGQ